MTLVAQIHVDSGEGPKRLADYRFLALPRVGERIMIGEDPSEVWLRIETITHFPVEPSEKDWDGMIILNCEIDS